MVGRRASARPLFSLVCFSLNANKRGRGVSRRRRVCGTPCWGSTLPPLRRAGCSVAHRRRKELVPPRWCRQIPGTRFRFCPHSHFHGLCALARLLTGSLSLEAEACGEKLGREVGRPGGTAEPLGWPILRDRGRTQQRGRNHLPGKPAVTPAPQLLLPLMYQGP
jgi:hypothetical protein